MWRPSLQTQKSGPYLFVSFIRNAVLSSHCRYLAPSGGFFCLLLGQIKKRAALAALFGESDASMRNFRDFFNVGFIDLLFDTICVFIAQQA